MRYNKTGVKKSTCSSKYYSRIDSDIASTLFRFGPLGYRELKRAIERRKSINRVLSEDVFSYHLKRMVNLRQVIRNHENWKRGQKLPYSLHPQTIQAVRLRIFEPNPPKSRKKGLWVIRMTKQQKFIKDCLFLLYLIVFKPSLCDGKKIYNPKAFTINDMLLAQGIGHFFDHKMSNTEIEKVLRILVKEGVVKVSDYYEDGFEIGDIRIASFIVDLFNILEGAVLPRLIIGLKNLDRISLESYMFYESIMGKMDTQRHFGKFREVRMSLERRYKKEPRILNEKKEMLDYNRYNIFEMLNNLRKDYSQVITEQPFLLNSFIETVCPKFMGADGSNKNYPKLLAVIG